jgi:ATP:ADP antiporter, AAA family
LQLLLTQKYLLGIFAISTIYEVVGTIMDYQMKMLAKEVYPSTESYTSFVASFGVAVNSLSFCIALLGTSYLLRRLGLRVCLLIFPCAVALVLGSVLFFPVLSVVFAAQVCLKGLSYALNNPTKEMLYIPTNPDVKFKVKSWIDMFGGRSAKALGAFSVDQIKYSIDSLLHFGTLIGFAWVGVWVFSALFVGRTWAVLTQEKEAASAGFPTPADKKADPFIPGQEEEEEQQ